MYKCLDASSVVQSKPVILKAGFSAFTFNEHNLGLVNHQYLMKLAYKYLIFVFSSYSLTTDQKLVAICFKMKCIPHPSDNLFLTVCVWLEFIL